MVNIAALCSSLSLGCSNHYTQGIDLDAQNVFETVSQTLSISTAGQYLLSIEWMAPASNPVGKSFEIKTDGSSLANVTCTTNLYTNQKSQFILSLNSGQMALSMKMWGTTPDGYGILKQGSIYNLPVWSTKINQVIQANKPQQIWLRIQVTQPPAKIHHKQMTLWIVQVARIQPQTIWSSITPRTHQVCSITQTIAAQMPPMQHPLLTPALILPPLPALSSPSLFDQKNHWQESKAWVEPCSIQPPKEAIASLPIVSSSTESAASWSHSTAFSSTTTIVRISQITQEFFSKTSTLLQMKKESSSKISYLNARLQFAPHMLPYMKTYWKFLTIRKITQTFSSLKKIQMD